MYRTVLLSFRFESTLPDGFIQMASVYQDEGLHVSITCDVPLFAYSEFVSCYVGSRQRYDKKVGSRTGGCDRVDAGWCLRIALSAFRLMRRTG